MKCNNCGAQLNEGQQYCQFCGAANNNQNMNYAQANSQYQNQNMNVGYAQMNNQYVTQNIIQNNYQNVSEKKENVLMGILGAIIGSLVGAGAIILLSQIGIVASIAGVAMAFCTLTLYEKFAGNLSAKGIVICILVMLVVTFFAENLALSIQIAKDSSYDTFYIFKNFFKLISHAKVVGEYIFNLVLVLVFTAGGAYGIIKNKLNDIKNK